VVKGEAERTFLDVRVKRLKKAAGYLFILFLVYGAPGWHTGMGAGYRGSAGFVYGYAYSYQPYSRYGFVPCYRPLGPPHGYWYGHWRHRRRWRGYSRPHRMGHRAPFGRHRW